MNDAVGSHYSATQAIEILERTSMYLCASRRERLGARIRASKSENLMSGIKQLSDNC
jgi:hypothetical protein